MLDRRIDRILSRSGGSGEKNCAACGLVEPPLGVATASTDLFQISLDQSSSHFLI
jgi:hypothetical protein